jgi:hypothetical protein
VSAGTALPIFATPPRVGECAELRAVRAIDPAKAINCWRGSVTFATVFLLGSMFGACVGFIAAGAARTLSSGNDETTSIAKRDLPAAMR